MASTEEILREHEVVIYKTSNQIRSDLLSSTSSASTEQTIHITNQDSYSNDEISSNHINLQINTPTESVTQTTTENRQHATTNDESMLIKVSDINNDITFLWRIRAVVTCEYPKRTFINTHGTGEISNWDLTDESGSITLVAFNLNSNIISDKLKENQAYEFTNLTIRQASDAFKTLPHLFQLVCTNATTVREIILLFDHDLISYNFTHLNQVNNIPMHSIIDVEVRVLRDYGISTGVRNENIWSRRNLHVAQDGFQFPMTLWNNQARTVDHNMAGLNVKFKHVKVSWFDGARVLITMGNTLLSIK